MLSRNYDFYLVITSYWPYGLPYNGSRKNTKCCLKQNTVLGKNRSM